MTKLTFLFVLFFSFVAFAQMPAESVYSRIRDATTPGAVATVAHPNVDNVAAGTVYALDTMGFGYCYDGANWDKLSCGSVAAAGCQCIAPPTDKYFMISATTAANTQANPIFSAVSKNTTINSVTNPIVVQVSNGTTANAQATPMYAAVSKDTSANAVTNPIFFEISNGTSANAQATPIYSAVSKDTSANALTNPIFCQLSDGTNAFLTSTSYPGYWRMQDGDSTTLGDVEAATADGSALTLNPLVTMANLMLYNGATMDMARNGAVKELQVTDIAVRPGEDAGNDWRKVKKQATQTYSPAKTGPTTVQGSLVDVCASTEILGYPNVCFSLKNVGGAGGAALTDVAVDVSPDGALWIPLTWTTCDSLAVGSGCTYCITGNANRYARIQAKAAAPANDTTVDCWVTANVN